jgi:hypothetical protein
MVPVPNARVHRPASLRAKVLGLLDFAAESLDRWVAVVFTMPWRLMWRTFAFTIGVLELEASRADA